MATMKRRHLRDIERAAKQGWDTPPEHRQRCIAAVQETIDNPLVSAAVKDTAIQAMDAMRRAGWCGANQPATA